MFNLMFRQTARASLAIASLTFVLSCSPRPPSDEALSAQFNQNRQLFDRVSRAFHSLELKCPYMNDETMCEIPNSAALLADLRRKAGVKALFVSNDKYHPVWLPVGTFGHFSMNTETRGLVYSDWPLEPLTDNTLHFLEPGQYLYKRLENGWYIYAAK